jgi:hypothetical protein
LIWNRLIQCSSTYLILVRRTQVHFCGVVVLALLFDEGAVPLGSHLAELARGAETARRSKTGGLKGDRNRRGTGSARELQLVNGGYILKTDGQTIAMDLYRVIGK